MRADSSLQSSFSTPLMSALIFRSNTRIALLFSRTAARCSLDSFSYRLVSSSPAMLRKDAAVTDSSDLSPYRRTFRKNATNR